MKIAKFVAELDRQGRIASLILDLINFAKTEMMALKFSGITVTVHEEDVEVIKVWAESVGFTVSGSSTEDHKQALHITV